jgi:hypothetical protein
LTTQNQMGLIGHDPLDFFALLKLHGLGQSGREIDVPLLTLFALNELHLSWETHLRILTSYITRYKPENTSLLSS